METYLWNQLQLSKYHIHMNFGQWFPSRMTGTDVSWYIYRQVCPTECNFACCWNYNKQQTFTGESWSFSGIAPEIHI